MSSVMRVTVSFRWSSSSSSFIIYAPHNISLKAIIMELRRKVNRLKLYIFIDIAMSYNSLR